MSSPLTNIPESDSSGPSLQGIAIPSTVSRMKACRSCKQFNILEVSNYANCRICRKKNNAIKRIKKKKLQFFDATPSNDALNDARGSPHFPDSAKPVPATKENVHPNTPVAVLHKAKARGPKERMSAVDPLLSKPLKDLDGEEQEVALRMMKARVERAMVKKDTRNLAMAAIDTSNMDEYQNARGLYEAAKSAILSASGSGNRIRFQGFHSVVLVETIDHPTRAKYVALDMRKIARAPFDRHNPVSIDSTADKVTTAYPCTCKGYQTLQPAPMKKTGNLLSWARVFKQQGGEAGSKTRVECHGTVVITVETDKSHPYGILGQRITVAIQHAESTAA